MVSRRQRVPAADAPAEGVDVSVADGIRSDLEAFAMALETNSPNPKRQGRLAVRAIASLLVSLASGTLWRPSPSLDDWRLQKWCRDNMPLDWQRRRLENPKEGS